MKVTPLPEHTQHDVHLEGADRVRMRLLIGADDGAQNFYMRHFEIQPGGQTPHHQHDYEHEVMVLKGQGFAKSEQGDRPFNAGDVIWVPPNEKHGFVNNGNEPVEFICLVPASRESSQ